MNIDMTVYESLTRTLSSSGQLETVINIFNRNVTERRAALKDAYELDERSKIKDIAHALKGSCGMFGAVRCADLCQEIENAALTADQPLPVHLLSVLLRELDEFDIFLERDLEENHTKPLH